MAQLEPSPPVTTSASTYMVFLGEVLVAVADKKAGRMNKIFKYIFMRNLFHPA
jgi:hypothetical protein